LLVAASAQAADLPVKAKPVEYVKICSLYGEGFYYIPGTDTCLRVGGYVRADYYYNASAGGTPNYTGAGGRQNRADTSDFATRVRANMMFDTRTQTPYGTLRTFESIHIQNQNQGTVSIVLHRGFIQWAGFTFGRAQSYVDIFYLDPYMYAGPFIGSSTDANGTNLAAYTWELGQGATMTGFIEERRSLNNGVSVANLSSAGTLAVGANPTNASNGEQFPDFGVAARWDQPWGSIGAFGVGHDASAAYWSAVPVGTGIATTPCFGGVGVTTCGNPGSDIGWAAGVGGTINLPMISPGDKIGAQFVYTQGAVGYVANGHTNAGLFAGGNTVALGWLTDGVFVTGSSVELTTAWSVVAAYEHNWTPQFKTSLYGAYLHVDYNNVATSFFCVAGTRAVAQSAFSGFSNCSPDYNFFFVGSRTQWSPVKDFALGVDVMYTGIDSAFAGTASLNSGIGARPTGLYTIKNEGILSVTFRAQRNY
jgi:hypothetical protein